MSTGRHARRRLPRFGRVVCFGEKPKPLRAHSNPPNESLTPRSPSKRLASSCHFAALQEREPEGQSHRRSFALSSAAHGLNECQKQLSARSPQAGEPSWKVVGRSEIVRYA